MRRREKSERRRNESQDTKRGGGRGTSRRSASRRTARDGAEDEVLPPLPDASEAVRSRSEFATAQTRARDAQEKLKKWERAFERDYGETPTAEDKGNSNTYGNYKRTRHAPPITRHVCDTHAPPTALAQGVRL